MKGHRDYHPDMSRRMQELLHDEMDSLRMMLNAMPARLGGVFAFVLFDDKGRIHTHYTSSLDEGDDTVNAAIGMMDVARSLLIGIVDSEEDDDE